MLTSKQLNVMGIPNEPSVMPLAMRLVNVALGHGADEGTMCESLRRLCLNPSAMQDDPLLGELATAMMNCLPDGGIFIPRAEAAPWQRWGNADVEAEAIEQMEHACLLPNAVRGALMPDAHLGYGLPIGGVLAVEGAVIPYAVGVDIACRMRLSVLDMPLTALKNRHDDLVEALECQTRFGIGAAFSGSERRKHQVMDEDWSLIADLGAGLGKDKAWSQLGTSGGGNHFVEFGELHVDQPVVLGGFSLEPGIYLALLSHSGSRGTGEGIAKHFSSLAMGLRPNLPKKLAHLAWLNLESEPGQAYWAAMELMGRYASANHELIHGHVLAHFGAKPLTHVENHHNFAWIEIHDGKKVVVHRKGATPAARGVQGIIPGSMGSSGFVVQGLGNEQSLASCSHGAGRRMSRAEAFRSLSRENMQAHLSKRNVELLGGSLDESPEAYKDIQEVMAVQGDLVKILARFEPRIVKMAPEHKERRFGKKARNTT